MCQYTKRYCNSHFVGIGDELAWFSDGPGRSRSRNLSLPRLMDFIQGHVRDAMTPLFFPPIRSNVTYSEKSGILGNRA